MRTVLLLSLMLGFGGTAMAEDERGPIAFGEDKFKISAGIFLAGFSTSLEVGSTIEDLNKIIDVENDLGLTSSTKSARAEAYWRDSYLYCGPLGCKVGEKYITKVNDRS